MTGTPGRTVFRVEKKTFVDDHGVMHEKEIRVSETRVFLWDNPELRRAFREAQTKEKVVSKERKARKG